jgi:hypothetical protein
MKSVLIATRLELICFFKRTSHIYKMTLRRFRTGWQRDAGLVYLTRTIGLAGFGPLGVALELRA